MEEDNSSGSDDLAIPDNPRELEECRQRLLATEKSQKLKERQLKAECCGDKPDSEYRGY